MASADVLPQESCSPNNPQIQDNTTNIKDIGRADAEQENISSGESTDSDEEKSQGEPVFNDAYMIAESHERLRLAMCHFNQHRRLDAKIVGNYARQLYYLVTCIAWLTLPTAASLIASHIFDAFVRGRDLKMYKNFTLLGFVSMLWMYGLWSLWSIRSAMKQSANALVHLNQKRWDYEDNCVHEMLTNSLIDLKVGGNQGTEACARVANDVEELDDEPIENEQKPASEPVAETGAAGDVIRVEGKTEKDKDV